MPPVPIAMRARPRRENSLKKRHFQRYPLHLVFALVVLYILYAVLYELK